MTARVEQPGNAGGAHRFARSPERAQSGLLDGPPDPKTPTHPKERASHAR